LDPSAYRKIGVELANARRNGEDELRFVLVSDSMAPILSAGDAVFIRIPEDIRIGDILSVHQGDEVFTHRLVGIKDGILAMKGDRNRRLDPPIPSSAVLGKLAAVERNHERIAWQASFWDRFVARLSLAEGRAFEMLTPQKNKPQPVWRRLFVQAITRPMRLIHGCITRRLAIKYGAGKR